MHKDYYKPDELQKIAVELESPTGNLFEARQNVKLFIARENEEPTASCPRCFSDIRIGLDQSSDHIVVFCGNCKAVGQF